MEITEDFKIGDRVVKSMKCEDDLVLLTKEEKTFKNMLHGLVIIVTIDGMVTIVGKLKVFRISKR